MKRKIPVIGIVSAIIGLVAGFGIPSLAHGPGEEAPPDTEQGAWQAMHEACEQGDWQAMTEAAEEVRGDIGYPCHGNSNNGTAPDQDGMRGHMNGV